VSRMAQDGNRHSAAHGRQVSGSARHRLLDAAPPQQGAGALSRAAPPRSVAPAPPPGDGATAACRNLKVWPCGTAAGAGHLTSAGRGAPNRRGEKTAGRQRCRSIGPGPIPPSTVRRGDGLSLLDA
jgi:hypothetical protein